MITNSSKPSDGYSESPSSRPMTLRQQLDLVDNWYHEHTRFHLVDVDPDVFENLIKPLNELCQEIAREALESLLDSELANTCVCQLADTAVCDHNWSLCNEIRERLSQQDTRSTVSDTEHSEIAPGQLTQKPPQPLADMPSGTSPKADSNQVDNSEEE